MPRWALALLVALAACSGGDGGAARESRGLIPVADRELAAVLTGINLTGEAVDTSELRGAPLVLNIWGSWCAPCKAEQPELERAARDTGGLGVKFLGIVVRDTKAQALAHVRTYSVSYPSVFDGTSGLVARLEVVPPNGIPSTVVLDRQGRIAVVLIGATTYDELVPLLRQVAEEPLQ